MPDVERKDLVAEGYEKLISHWKDKPKAVGLLVSYLREIQKVEDLLHEINDGTSLNTAIGAQLDVIGVLIGVERDGQQDPIYRDAIKSRIGLTDASGTIPDVKAVAKLVANSTVARVYEHFPACAYLYTNGLVSRTSDLAIQGAHVGGVRSRVLWFDGDNHFHPAGIRVEGETPIVDEGSTFELSVDHSNGSSYLLADHNDNVFVVDSAFFAKNNNFDTLTDNSAISRASFTSLDPDEEGYAVIDDRGKFCSLVPFAEGSVSTGYIIDHLGRYIVTDKSEYIRYVKFENI